MKSVFSFLIWCPCVLAAQNVHVSMVLNATEGGYHSNILVTLVDTVNLVDYSGTTDIAGRVMIDVPGGNTYKLVIEDFMEQQLMEVPNAPGTVIENDMTYSLDMPEQAANFEMSVGQKAAVDYYAEHLPDTNWFGNTRPDPKINHCCYQRLAITIVGLNNEPISGETVTLAARKRKKVFKGITDDYGDITFYLPKGDEYDLSFYYHKNFEYTECRYTKGTSEVEWTIEYIGSKAYKKLMDEALAKLNAEKNDQSTNLVSPVFDRNKFTDPLIICDASTSMSMIMDDIKKWYQDNEVTYPNAQFVFFNDGDGKGQGQKEIGKTGGIYYTDHLPVMALWDFIDSVYAKGSDTDRYEKYDEDNYIEAILEGMKMAKRPYSNIILIVDNHCKVRDMELLPQVNKPIHIIITCSVKAGCRLGFVQPDYLKIAYETKGTIHNDAEDYNDIGSMKEGDVLSVGTGSFELRDGIFIQVH